MLIFYFKCISFFSFFLFFLLNYKLLQYKLNLMGVKNDKIYNEIPSNDELNDKIRKKKINEIKNPEEIKKFNGLINDNIQKNIKRSDFKTNFEKKYIKKQFIY